VKDLLKELLILALFVVAAVPMAYELNRMGASGWVALLLPCGIETAVVVAVFFIRSAVADTERALAQTELLRGDLKEMKQRVDDIARTLP